ncbi:MAG: restriction endonuclease subunit S [Lachnospiraceae bacterium]|nr:restriction endonuclease subunit S [Lachnospiraceae bacterium]
MSFKYTEIGKIPVEWDVKMIQEIGEVVGGGTPKTKEDSYWDGNISWITPKDLSSFTERYIEVGERSITELGLKNSSAKLLPKGTVLFSSRAPIGYLAIARKELCTNQGFKNIVCDKKYSSNEFLFYMLKAKKNEIESIAGGSTFKEVSGKVVKEFKIPIPPLNEQKAIAHILSTLDDKIEVNKQINKTLENMAEAIFKQWFVDFEFPNEDGEPYKSSGGEMVESELGMIPKGWGVKELREIIDIIKQGTKPGEHLKDRKYNPIDTLPMKSIAINDFKPYEEAKSSLILFEKYDILIGAMRVYFHRVNLAPYKGITRTTTFVLRSKRIQDVPYNLFLLNMDETIDYAERTSKGSTMPYAVWDNGMSNMLTAYSNKELRNNFFEITQPMLETIMKRSAENEVLIKLRDSILPKLMSGKIRVPLDSKGEAS